MLCTAGKYVVKQMAKAVRISHQLSYVIGGYYTSEEAYRDSSPPMPLARFRRFRDCTKSFVSCSSESIETCIARESAPNASGHIRSNDMMMVSIRESEER
jgi:hypothetical protein